MPKWPLSSLWTIRANSQQRGNLGRPTARMSENTASAEAKDKEAAGAKNRTASKKRTSAADPSLNMDEIRELSELVNEYRFTDFEFENENIRIRLSKMATSQVVQAIQPSATAPVAVSPQSNPPVAF